MRITLRTSGGRGEYELSGSQGKIRSLDLVGREIFFELAPDLIIPSYSRVLHVQGKPRIRLQKRDASHAYLVLSSILLLPRPIRELTKTPESTPVMLDCKYSIIGVDVDVRTFDADYAILRPKTIIAGNSSKVINSISVVERMANIYLLWTSAEKHSGRLADLILEHREAIASLNLSHKAVIAIATKIRELVGRDGNIAKQALGKLDPDDFPEDDDGLQIIEIQDGDPMLNETEDDPSTSSESTRKLIMKWRKVLTRGIEGRKFSKSVKEIYNFRCAFSGKRLPPTENIIFPGVDSCHILPWAKHQVNEISNGICLNKLCHWAFDSGVLRLDFIDSKYRLSVPEETKNTAKRKEMDLEYFLALEGYLNTDYLPADKSKWPRPDFIKKLNESMYQ